MKPKYECRLTNSPKATGLPIFIAHESKTSLVSPQRDISPYHDGDTKTATISNERYDQSLLSL